MDKQYPITNPELTGKYKKLFAAFDNLHLTAKQGRILGDVHDFYERHYYLTQRQYDALTSILEDVRMQKKMYANYNLSDGEVKELMDYVSLHWKDCSIDFQRAYVKQIVYIYDYYKRFGIILPSMIYNLIKIKKFIIKSKELKNEL